MNHDDTKKDIATDNSAAPVEDDEGWPLDTGVDSSENPSRKVGDRTKPLADHRQEMVAQFLAAPTGCEGFASVKALAVHLKISRATFYRWARDTYILRRIEYLSLQNKVAGDLLVRRAWPAIMRTVVDEAIAGNMQAVKICKDCAWPESSDIGQEGLTIEEAVRSTENTGRVDLSMTEFGFGLTDANSDDSEPERLPEPTT